MNKVSVAFALASVAAATSVQASEGDTRFLRTQFRTMVQAAIID
jgi:hypothetical protein